MRDRQFHQKKKYFNLTVAKEIVFNIQNNLQYIKLNSYNYYLRQVQIIYVFFLNNRIISKHNA